MGAAGKLLWLLPRFLSPIKIRANELNYVHKRLKQAVQVPSACVKVVQRSFSTSPSWASTYPSYVKIIEVGPRDGLQNEQVNFQLISSFL